MYVKFFVAKVSGYTIFTQPSERFLAKCNYGRESFFTHESFLKLHCCLHDGASNNVAPNRQCCWPHHDRVSGNFVSSNNVA